MKYPSRQARVIASFVLAVTGAILWFFLRTETLPQVTILPMPSTAPKPLSWKQRVMEKIPDWAWRLKLAVLGPARTINLEATIIELPADASAALSNLSLGRPQFASNAVRAWVLPPEALKPFREKINEPTILFLPRITTSDGVEANLTTGESIPAAGPPLMVGLVFNCDAQCRRQTIDLKTSFWITQAITNQTAAAASISVVTNLALAARVQIPDQGGIFLLSPASRAGKPIQIGTLISGAMR